MNAHWYNLAVETQQPVCYNAFPDIRPSVLIDLQAISPFIANPVKTLHFAILV